MGEIVALDQRTFSPPFPRSLAKYGKSKMIKPTKDSGHMVRIKARVRLEWAEEGNLPKKPTLKAIRSQYFDLLEMHVHRRRLTIVICIFGSRKKRTRYVCIISNYCN